MKIACLALLTGLLTQPASAQSFLADMKDGIRLLVDCKPGEGVEVTLDYARANGRPLVHAGFVTRSQACKTGDTTYRLEGFPGAYRSPADIRRAIEAYRVLVELKASAHVEAFAYLRSLDAAERGTAEVAKK